MLQNKKPPNQKINDYLDFLTKQPKGFIYMQEAKKKEIALPQDAKKTLGKLYDNYKNCKKCPLSKLGRKQVVFGQGNPQAKLMFVGEGPGREEDEMGIPFVGRAGKLLTKIIEAMRLKRKDAYITNVVKCRPPNNRTPLPQESEICKKLILLKEIEIINPQIICTLGACATQALLGNHVRITKTRGTFFSLDKYKIIPTYHPAYLLRNPAAKKNVWQDMKKIIEELKNTFSTSNNTFN